jgi:hypothetical protein
MMSVGANDPLRRLLRAAIAARVAAKQVVTQADASLQTASTCLKAAQDRLARFAGVEETLAQHRRQIEKAWAASGGAGPRQAVPPDVLQNVVERDQAADDVAAAASAVTSIKADLDKARVTLATCERQCSQAAAAIIAHHAITLAAELRAAQELVWSLSNDLRGISRLWVPNTTDDKTAPLVLPRAVLNSLDRPEPPAPPAQNKETLAIMRWSIIHRELQSHPDFDLEQHGGSDEQPHAQAS